MHRCKQFRRSPINALHELRLKSRQTKYTASHVGNFNNQEPPHLGRRTCPEDDCYGPAEGEAAVDKDHGPQSCKGLSVGCSTPGEEQGKTQHHPTICGPYLSSPRIARDFYTNRRCPLYGPDQKNYANGCKGHSGRPEKNKSEGCHCDITKLGRLAMYWLDAFHRKPNSVIRAYSYKGRAGLALSHIFIFCSSGIKLKVGLSGNSREYFGQSTEIEGV